MKVTFLKESRENETCFVLNHFHTVKVGSPNYKDSHFVSMMSEEIASTVSQVSEAVQNMAQTVQESNEQAERIKENICETTKAIEEMVLTTQIQMQLAQKLNEMVQEFII